MMNNVKQVIVMRKDLNMRKGKIAAQAGHACLAAVAKVAGAIRSGITYNYNKHKCELIKDTHEVSTYLQDWFDNSFTKICVYVNSERELLDIEQQAIEAGFITALIKDNGTTEFNGVPTYTCLAFEPLPAEQIDEITGNLPLY